MCNPSDVQSAQVRALERRVRRLQFLCSTTLLLVSAAFLMGQSRAQQDTIVARRFVLVDSSGSILATFGGSNEMRCSLEMRGSNDSLRARIGLMRDDSPEIALYDHRGMVRLSAGFVQDRTTNLIFKGARGQPRFRIETRDDRYVDAQQTALTLFDREGNHRASLSVQPLEASFRLHDAQARRRCLLTSGLWGDSMLEFRGGAGDRIAWFGSKRGKPEIRFIHGDSLVWGAPPVQ